VTGVAGFTITGLGAETALVALELYRRHTGWKVRAVGQGYAGGLVELLRDQGLPEARGLALAIHAAVAPAAVEGPGTPSAGEALSGPVPERHPGAAAVRSRPAARRPGPTGNAAGPGPVDYTHPRRRKTCAPSAAASPEPVRPVAGNAAGWTLEERLHNQVWGMFEDLARAVAAYRGAVGFAESRLDQELDRLLADPRTRLGPAAEAALAQARAKQADLVGRARAVLDRDLAQLTAESEVVEPALPPALAAWHSHVWHGYQVPVEISMAVRVGDVHLPEHPALRIPMLVPLPRGLWIDSAQDHRLAMEVAVALAARLLASYPAGEFAVRVIDPGRTATATLAPLADSGALPPPAAAGAAGVNETIAVLTHQVDLMHMASGAGQAGALPPDLDAGSRLLIVNDFPYGFDDRAITRLRYLADEGPAVGVHLLIVADRADALEYGPVLDPLWRSLLRLTPVPDDHLVDPWVGHSWTFEPMLSPQDSQVLARVLGQVVAARRV
jgi:hypothetical protein